MGEIVASGIKYVWGPYSIGVAGGGQETALGAIRMIRARGLQRLKVLDMCCGVGFIGLTLLKELGREVVADLTLSDINIFNIRALKDILRLNGLEGAARVILSDGFGGFVATDAGYNLIVSNPPHSGIADYDELTASIIGGLDEGWEFHKSFYRQVAERLAPNGEVWFLENASEGVEPHVVPVIEANPGLLYLGRQVEPAAPAYFWMVTTRRKPRNAP